MELKELSVFESVGLNDLPDVAEEVLALTANTKVILFQGNLGAGKTTLAKEVCRALGSADEFSSPTYSIVNEYKTSVGSPVYHMDLYRLKTEAEAADAGVEDYLFSGNYCLVEWFENAKELLPEKYILVKLEGEGNTPKNQYIRLFLKQASRSMGTSSSKDFSGIVTKLGLQPMEAPVMTANKKAKLFIGIPKEQSFQEHRIALTPESVRVLVANGHRIVIEEKAGKDSHFYDNDFSEAGAEILKDVEEVYKADVILKVAPPMPYEIELMQHNQTLISPLHLPTLRQEYIEMLMKKKVTAMAYEYTKDDAGLFPFVRSMSEIAGSTVVLIAGEFLSNANNGKGILLGGIAGVPPAKVVILGAGVVGTFAAKAILGLGAIVSVFDNNVYKLMRLQERVGSRVFTSTIQPDILMHELETADVVIGAIHSKKGRTPIIVTEHMVERMKTGSLIIDVSIDQGGCFETSEITSHKDPTFKKHGVIHFCVPNITSRVSRTASYAFSNILTPILLRMGELQGMQGLIYEDVGIRNGIYIYKGNLTNEHLAKIFRIKHSNLELLFASNL